MRKGYIYYILDLTNADMYIGSCWKERWNGRKIAHKNMDDISCASTNIIKNNNYIFEIFEENEFIDKIDRFKREQFYMDNNKCINKQRAYNSDEYNREYNKNKCKEWNDKNKEEQKIKKKENYEKNKKLILEQKKQYYEKNKEEIKKKRREYYQKKNLITNR